MEQNIICRESIASSSTEHATPYKIDNRTVYDILDQICKDTDLFPYVFISRVHEELGSQVLPRDIDDVLLEDTLQYDLYEDETQKDRFFTCYKEN